MRAGRRARSSAGGASKTSHDDDQATAVRKAVGGSGRTARTPITGAQHAGEARGQAAAARPASSQEYIPPRTPGRGARPAPRAAAPEGARATAPIPPAAGGGVQRETGGGRSQHRNKKGADQSCTKMEADQPTHTRRLGRHVSGTPWRSQAVTPGGPVAPPASAPGAAAEAVPAAARAAATSSAVAGWVGCSPEAAAAPAAAA